MTRSSPVVWIEIPAADFDRATRFYESLFGTALRHEQVGPVRLGVFPYEKPAISGAVIAGPGYQPGGAGPVVYLNADGRFDALLARVGEVGGAVLGPVVELPGGMGRFVHFRDSEGNRVALHAAA